MIQTKTGEPVRQKTMTKTNMETKKTKQKTPDDFKSFEFETKSVDVPNRIVEGYAAAFENIDGGGDKIVRGAFKKTIADRFPRNLIKLLYQHDFQRPIGRILEMREDDFGLWVKCQISQTDLGDEVLQLAADGVIAHFSIGFITIRADRAMERGQRIRVLRELKLMECSLVTVPMNESAIVTAVKSLTDTLSNSGQLNEYAVALELKKLIATIQMDSAANVEQKGVPEFADFPVSNSDTFDSAFAMDKLDFLTRGENDEIDTEKLQSAHLIVNGETMAIQFVDVTDDGELVVTLGSLRHAAEQLVNGDGVPDADVGPARAMLSMYYDKMNAQFPDLNEIAPWEQTNENESDEKSGDNADDSLDSKQSAMLMAGVLGILDNAANSIRSLFADLPPPEGTANDETPNDENAQQEIIENITKMLTDFRETLKQ